MTSLFSNSWMCRLCGREVCSDCFNQVRELTYSPPDATPQQSMALAQKRERYNNLNPFFLSCTRRSEHRFHDLTPVTRFSSGELATAIDQMTELLRGIDVSDGASPTPDARSTLPHEHQDSPFSHYSRSSSSRSLLTRPAVDDTYTPSNTPPHVAEIPIDRLQIIQANAFDEPGASLSSFAPLWSQGVPLLVKGLSSRFKLDWTPQYLSEQHGDQGCIVIDCQTDANKRITIKEFFNDFGNYANRGDACWKLKVRLRYQFASTHLTIRRTGLPLPTSKPLFLSFSMTSAKPCPYRTTYDVMASTILVPISQQMRSVQTLVRLSVRVLFVDELIIFRVQAPKCITLWRLVKRRVLKARHGCIWIWPTR